MSTPPEITSVAPAKAGPPAGPLVISAPAADLPASSNSAPVATPPVSPKQAPAANLPASSNSAPVVTPPASPKPSASLAPERVPLTKAAPADVVRPEVASAPPPGRPRIGATAEGMPVHQSFQPTAGALAIMLTPFVRNSHSLEGVLPLPDGLKLTRSPDRVGHQIQLRTAPLFAKKMRRTFGYVAEIKLTDGEGCGTPAQLQIVTRVPWRYGSTAAEKECIWALFRIQAFTSKSLFATPARAIQLGAVVRGFLEPSSGDTKSCQMVGWGVCDLSEWRMRNPHTVPANFELDMD